MDPSDIHYFELPKAFGRWLAEHGEKVRELWVGFHRKGTGRRSLTWEESVDEALRFGWINGIRKRLDDDSYTIRFTPRKRGSTWSRVNVARVAALTNEGMMRPPGMAAFEAKSRPGPAPTPTRTRSCHSIRRPRPGFARTPKAWTWWLAQAPGYRRTVTRWCSQRRNPRHATNAWPS